MSKLNVKSIQMRNFGTVRQAEVKFPERGFVLVNGRNMTGFESVGSGKTLLGEALSRTLFNVPGRYTKFSGYSFNGEGNTYVQVVAELEGQSLVVELGYKCPELNKGGEGLRFTLGNQAPVMYGSMHDTRKELLRMFGMQTDVAGWTVYIDGSELSFDSLAESKAVNLLMGALNQPPWTEHQKKAAKVLDKFRSAYDAALNVHNSTKLALDQAQQSLSSACVELTTAQTTYDTQVQQQQIRRQQRTTRKNELNAQLDDLTTKMSQLKKQIELATNSEAAAYHQAEIEAQRAASAFAEAQRNESRLQKEYGEKNKALEEAKSNKQKAITEYTQQTYAQLNAELIRIQTEISTVNQSNSSGKSNWDKEESKKSRALTTAQTSLQIAQSDLATFQAALDREVNTPSVCPLAGCGKAWPKNNQKLVEAAQQKVSAQQTKVQQLQEKANLAQSEYDALIAAPFVAKEVPALPAEQAIPPFPQEADWDASILSLFNAATECHAKLTAQISTVALTEAQSKAAAQKVTDLKQASQVAGLSQQYEELETQETRVRGSLKELDEAEKNDVLDSKSIDLIRVKVQERTNSVQQHQAKLSETAQEVSDCEEAQKIAGFWVEAFGPAGIPNMIIEEAVAPLNAVSRRVSLHMTGGLLEVAYSTKRELSRGDSVNELIIETTNKFGSKQVVGSSKGETGLLDLITAETLAEVGNTAARVNYRWYDEIARSQDQTVRRSIFSYLKELAEKAGILTFVVDHSVEVASYADHILVAEKTACGTTYVWQ